MLHQADTDCSGTTVRTGPRRSDAATVSYSMIPQYRKSAVVSTTDRVMGCLALAESGLLP